MAVNLRAVAITGGREGGLGIAGGTVSAIAGGVSLFGAADQAAVAAAIATLVADGATPTQAHVTALNTVWGTAVTNAAALQSYGIVVLFDAVAIATQTFFRACLREIVQLVAGDGALKP